MAHIVVIVLGDIGRSPRMQYHAQSLCGMDEVERVTVVGYGGETVLNSLQNNSKVHIRAIELNKLRYLEAKSSTLRAILKGTFLLCWLLYTLLFGIPNYQAVLIQNPPALPAFFVAFFVSFFNRSKIVLDWHNLGFSIYEHGLKSKTHPLVLLTKYCEHFFCRYASYHLCVSKALQTYLVENCGINGTVVYDRPPNLFQIGSAANCSEKSRTEFLLSLGVQNIPESICAATNPALIVSGTSWTADEDFSILLDALMSIEQYLIENFSSERKKKNSQVFAHDALICVVTGKGELKAMYEEKMVQLYCEKKLGQFVSVHTAWLAMEDYPRLLQNADMGISLHSSTSGLDLPMKVLDMFGSGLPVLALDFPTLPELVTHDRNGLVFGTSDELCSHLIFALFTEKGNMRVKSWQKELQLFDRWDTNWDRTVLPIIRSILSKQ